jgi:hypothetical protein
VVTLAGETEDEEEWFERYLVDPRTGEIRGRLDAPLAHQYDFELLGYAGTGSGGRLCRRPVREDRGAKQTMTFVLTADVAAFSDSVERSVAGIAW